MFAYAFGVNEAGHVERGASFKPGVHVKERDKSTPEGECYRYSCISYQYLVLVPVPVLVQYVKGNVSETKVAAALIKQG